MWFFFFFHFNFEIFSIFFHVSTAVLIVLKFPMYNFTDFSQISIKKKINEEIK